MNQDTVVGKVCQEPTEVGLCDQHAHLYVRFEDLSLEIQALINEAERRADLHASKEAIARKAFEDGFDCGYKNADDSFPGPELDEAWELFIRQ